MQSAFGVCDNADLTQTGASTFVHFWFSLCCPQKCLLSMHPLQRVCHIRRPLQFRRFMPPMRLGLMFGVALTSAVAGIFDLKHYLNLQLVPHISKHHQASNLKPV